MLSEVYMHLEKMPAAICEYLRFLYDKRGAAGIPVVASGCVKRHLEKAHTAKTFARVCKALHPPRPGQQRMD